MPTPTFTLEQPLPNRTDTEEELRGLLAARLIGEGPLSEIMHSVLGVMAAILIWPVTSHRIALAWLIVIALAALLRFLLRLRARESGLSRRTVSSVRIGVSLLTVAWALGVLIIGRTLPLELLAFLMVLVSGVVAGATLALLADPPSFYVTAAGLLGSVIVAIASNGSSRANVVGAVLITIFGVAMLLYYRRSHDALVKQLRTTQALAIASAEAQSARMAAEQLVRIVEATTDHVGVGDADGRLRYLNRAGREMLGIDADEDITTLSVRDITPPRLHETIRRDDMPKMMREGVLHTETALLHRDGREIPVSLVGIAHRGPDGEVDSISVVARDMTEQQNARHALQVARDAAEQAAAAKSAFLANTSHEIRTPLNGILGMVELLLDTELTPAQRRSVELIASSGETLLNVINDVLDLSKIEAGQMELEHIPFDLHNVVHSTVRLLITRANAKNLELVSDVADDVPQRVTGDPHRLRQVLGNLIGNAIKFTPAGEVVVTARLVSSEAGRARVRVGVRDTGIGISADHLQRIFEPFRQADASTTREYGGTGLGLSISRRLVDMMGGTLEVETAPNRGSYFHFVLEWPVASDSAAETQRSRGTLRGIRALVVDDHAANRRILGDMLRWAGADAQEVSTVDGALASLARAAAEGHPFRLVVSDVQMPGRDGFDLAAAMREEPRLRTTRLMLLTSGGRPGDGERCRELGVAAYMQKPVSRVELVEAALVATNDSGSSQRRPSLVTRSKLDERRARLRVLLAEDNPVNQEVAASLLRKRGHDVHIVANGREAVEAVQRHGPFDVVLMDVQMPELDGLQATAQIRALGEQALPIVALTANVSDGERERCMQSGMSAYLAKPFKPHELYAQVEGWSRAHAADEVVARMGAAVDLSGFRAMLDAAGIPEIGDRMLAIFLDDTPPRIAALEDAAGRGDLTTAAFEAHRVASAAGSIYAHELERLLRATERAATSGDADAVRREASRAVAEFARVRDSLQAGAST